MRNSYNLTSGNLSKQILQIATPASVGFFFHTMFNVADTYFASKISSEAIAAMTLTFPLFFVIISISSGISSGTTAVIGKFIGARSESQATAAAAHTLLFAIVASIATCIFGLKISSTIYSTMGASGSYLQACHDYMDPLFYGAGLFIIPGALNGILQAQGKTKPYRNILILSFFLNLILDPLFLYGGFGIPALGLRGIALATLCTQVFGLAYLIIVISRTGIFANPNKLKLWPSTKEALEFSRLCLGPAATMLTVALGISVINYLVSRFGQNAVAGFGIAMRIEQIVLLPSIGLNVAALSITSQCYGAKEYARIRLCWHSNLRYAAIIAAIGFTVLNFSGRNLISLFADDGEVIETAFFYLRYESFILFAYMALYISANTLQGMHRVIMPFFVGVLRQIILPIAVYFALVNIGLEDISTVWISVVIATVLGCLIISLYTKRAINNLRV